MKERNHGLTHSDAEILLDLLRNCANAAPNRNDSTEHIKAVIQPGVWGTQVELQVISDCFGVPVFIGMPNSQGVYHWCAFKPKFDAFPQGSKSRLSIPGYPFSREEEFHIEIVQNTTKSHYDSVIPVSKSACLGKPALRRDMSDTIIL